MQEWYGKGKFTDKGNKRTLYFLEADSTYKIDFGKLYYETNFMRVLKIRGKKFKSKDFYGTTRKRYVIFEKREK